MSLVLDCDACGVELTVPSALLFGPPLHDGVVTKRHLCPDCYHICDEFVIRMARGRLVPWDHWPTV